MQKHIKDIGVINVEAGGGEQTTSDIKNETKTDIKIETKKVSKSKSGASLKQQVYDMSQNITLLQKILNEKKEEDSQLKSIAQLAVSPSKIDDVEKVEPPKLEEDLPVIESKQIKIENEERKDPLPFENSLKANTIRSKVNIVEVKQGVFNNKRIMPKLGRSNNPYNQ